MCVCVCVCLCLYTTDNNTPGIFFNLQVSKKLSKKLFTQKRQNYTIADSLEITRNILSIIIIFYHMLSYSTIGRYNIIVKITNRLFE